MTHRALAALLLSIAAAPAPGQDFDFEPPADAASPELTAAIRDLAERVLPVYQEDDPDRYFATLAALQMAVGDPAAAYTTRLTLRERLQTESGPPPGRLLVYEIYTQARALEATESIPFAEAYARAFREAQSGMDDLAAYRLEGLFTVPAEREREALQRALDARAGTASITLEEALELLQAWFVFDAYRSFTGIVQPLLAADSERRYDVAAVAIPLADGAEIAATVVLPRAAAAGPLPALLEVTLERAARDSREAAAHGYAGVLALARIAGAAEFRPRAPFETDGDDARAVIEWIAAQSWSDGRVAMQGSGYGGFVAWSVAKLPPPALRAIATADPMAPGIDVPSVNRIFRNGAYRWVHEVLAAADDDSARDEGRWRSVDEDWYRSGRPYRELPVLPGRASAVFRSWLNHPSYDRFWQKWLPFGAEFASVGIPVLTVTGYYSAGETAALYYFSQHHEHDPNADHTLLIGPFNEQAVEQGAAAAAGGLALDPTARIDPGGARYAWFEHVLRGAERPDLLQAPVNYQLAGADAWRHAPSLAALEEAGLRLYLAGSPGGDETHGLAAAPPSAPLNIVTTADLGERDAPGWRPTRELVSREIDPHYGTQFVSEPFAEPIDIAGRFGGQLDFTINKYDVDLTMMLYELKPDGEHVKLFDPAHAFRTSYARDRVNRRLLTAGVRQQLPFKSERMIGRRLAAGSRLVLTVAINKRVDQQINYGGGGDVSEESIEDAGTPVRIRWHEGSYVEIPVQRPPAAEDPAQ